jgi:predicted transcriptional regulator of viral defense system
VERQLSRWTASGRLTKVRRGLYSVPAPHRVVRPEVFEVSNRLVRPSYVSLESALHFHELIPDVPFAVTAITTGRSGAHETPLGRYVYRHLGAARFWGFDRVEIAPGRHAHVARPEKALLDLVYLRRGGDEPGHIRELRLQNTERLDLGVLDDIVRRFGGAKMRRAFDSVRAIVAEDSEGWVTL